MMELERRGPQERKLITYFLTRGPPDSPERKTREKGSGERGNVCPHEMRLFEW